MTAMPPPSGSTNDPTLEEAVERVRKALQAIKFGSVTITVHDGRVMQIDITERERLSSN